MKLTNLFAGTMAVVLLAACAPSAYKVSHPSPSGLRFEQVNQVESSITQLDSRDGNERIFHSGALNSTLQLGNAAIEPMSFLAKNAQEEFISRGLPVSVKMDGAGMPISHVHTFKMTNHRTNGYTPYISMTWLSADIETVAGKKRVAAFVKRGKVPVWSFDEIIEPTLNQPLSLAVKEYAAKVSKHLYGYQSSDTDVAKLVEKINGKRTDTSYMDVYALGFTNNPKAIEPLVKLVSDADEYIRLAAISSLGNIGAISHMGTLKQIYTSAGNWSDRAMALKAIGDMDTDESRAFLAQERAHWESSSSDKESAWNIQLINLYL